MVDSSKKVAEQISLRPGLPNDNYTCFKIYVEALFDLNYRGGHRDSSAPPQLSDYNTMWEDFGSLYAHLKNTGAYFWVAARDDELIGYARSTVREGVLELTEFFIRPNEQTQGVGRALLEHAFPRGQYQQSLIIATLDQRAQARYLKAGTYPITPVYTFGGTPHVNGVTTGLDFESIQAAPDTLETLAKIDTLILGHRRDEDHEWLLGNRQGYLYIRRGEVVGYGYEGRFNGPFALLDKNDYPTVLTHTENEAAAQEQDFGIDIPLANRAAVDHMLERGHRISPFIAMIMADTTHAQFEKYILTSPQFFI